MKKINGRTVRTKKKSRPKKMKVDHSRMNIDSKYAHNREVKMQLRACDEFIDQINDTLQRFAERIDAGESLGKYHNECIAVLDTMNSDLHDFADDLRPIQQQAIAFLEDDEGEAWSWTMNSHSICESLNLLRDQHVVLYMTNFNTLMDQIDL